MAKKSQERMQTQAKPSNRNNERNNPKTVDNIFGQSIVIKKEK